jgi:hypothetical protein
MVPLVDWHTAAEIPCAATDLADLGTGVSLTRCARSRDLWCTLMGSPAPHVMNIVTVIKQLAELATASAEVVDALQAIRDGYTEEEYERLEAEHPLIASLVSSACDLEYALEAEG